MLRGTYKQDFSFFYNKKYLKSIFKIRKLRSIPIMYSFADNNLFRNFRFGTSSRAMRLSKN